MRTLNWTWTKDDKNIKIYDGEKVIGHIPSFYDNIPSTINGKQFFIDSPRRMFRTFISDPLDNKAYCEIDLIEFPTCRLFCPAFEYIGESASRWRKRKWSLFSKGTRMAEMETEVGFFKDKGIINILVEDNYELAIYSLFYFNIITEPCV
ncbi:MAG: hypothetical protein V4511_00730 [Bacteroidota bacterium]